MARSGEGNFIPIIPNKLQSGVAIGLAALAMGGEPAPAVAGSPLPPPTPHEALTPEQLPGHGIRVTPSLQRQLADSTVKLYNGYIGKDNQPVIDLTPGRGFCTGVRLQLGNFSGVSTAAHCYGDLTQSSRGILPPADSPQAPPALDFIGREQAFNGAESVADPQQAPKRRLPLGTITGISIDRLGVDAALLKVGPAPAAPQAAPKPPRRLSEFSRLTRDPQARIAPGQEVGLYGVPGINQDEPVEAKGIYLGQVSDVYYDPDHKTVVAETLNMVETQADQPYNDPCYYGASGSSFIARATTFKDVPLKDLKDTFPKSADVKAIPGKYFVSGPLSIRANLKYDPYIAPFNIIAYTPRQRLKKAMAIEKSIFALVKQQLGVKVDSDKTLCGFSVVNKTVDNSLVGGFGRMAPPIPGKGGGNMPDMK